jgi:hypothetical protein
LGLWGSARGKLLERSFPLDTLQELSKKLYLTMFLEVFEIPKNFFSKSSLVGSRGKAPALQTAI